MSSSTFISEQQQLLDFLMANPQGVSAGQIEEYLHENGVGPISRPALIKRIELLAKQQPIVKEGAGRGTRYRHAPGETSSISAPNPTTSSRKGKTTLVLGENLLWLKSQPDACFDLIYIDPPFNTGKVQKRTPTLALPGSEEGHAGFGGRNYQRVAVGQAISYQDKFDDFIADFLGPRLEQAYRLLSPNGSIFVHLDPRESHYAKVFMDTLFGRACFRNEIIWSYDYGARSRDRWSSKHDTILWYSKNPKSWTFNYDAIDRIPYMAPGLVGEEKAARGKTPTDVWWNTIVSPTGKEKTGYPTQKPLAILERIVSVHSNPEDRLLDFFAGSGSFGHAASKHGRDCVLVDQNKDAADVIQQRFTAAQLPLEKQVLSTPQEEK